MVRIRQTSVAGIAEVPFSAPVQTPAGVEVMSLADLRSRASPDVLDRPQRPAFHHLLTLDSGSLEHTVDFTRYRLESGQWLWVRPGQVHHWSDLAGAEGALVLFEPDALDRATAAVVEAGELEGPVVRTATADNRSAVRAAVDHLASEFAAPLGLPVDLHVAVVRHLLAVLVLRIAQLPAPPGGPGRDNSETYRRFRDAVERGFARSRRLHDYARALGYSPRTLSRATQSATGVGGKEFIDRRVILEAKRLLAHSDRSAAQIAGQLGFSSATNFGKYFHERTGTSPIAFRNAARGSGAR